MERYRLFTTVAGRLATAEVEHPRWSLRRARILRLDQGLFQAGGLTAPVGEPLAHTSAGVPVRGRQMALVLSRFAGPDVCGPAHGH